MFAILRPALMVFITLSILTGALYPLFVTGVAQLIFPVQANGSLMERVGKPIGSELIGQPFDDPKYFWGRLSATPDFPYNSASSSGSNLGPSNPALVEEVKARVEALQKADLGNKSSIPIDLVTSSGSGLDPHISPAAALYQASRVARFRGLSEERVRTLVDQFTEPRQWGFLGEPRVNVLRLNLALDGMQGQSKSSSPPFSAGGIGVK
ncbi:MAG TPA: potassium-transporting ATPase subunit KdpC [Thermodesulfobacteriota bacterium]|nr:potassium-transporting ATPase subunit KdpC [Thermodesulfobacteriota bacterium]